MKIGIDCRTILSPKNGEKAGVGHYTYYLVKNLLKIDKKNEYVLFFDHRVTNTKEFKKKNVKIVRFPFSEYKKYMPFGYSHLFISKILNNEELDIFHSPANVVPLNYKKPTVLTVHDLAIYNNPEWFPPKQKFATKIAVPKSVAKADKIIAISESTKRSITKLFKTSNKKIKVIYEGFAKEKKASKAKIKKIRKKFKIQDKFVFCISTVEPRKNMQSLVKAFDELVCSNFKKYEDFQLILAGNKGWKYAPIFKAIKQAKCGKVRYIGYIKSDEKSALLTEATCFAFPSLYEGFGLPVLEAMSLGTPVVTSKVSSLPEVVGKAGVLVNPNSIKSIQKGLEKALKNKRALKSYSKKSRQQARKFSWNKCARQTLKVYKEVYKQNK